MSIFAFLIANGLILGVITLAIPMTRKMGTTILTCSGILFIIACGMLLLGKLFMILLPFIVVGCILYAIYLGKNKIKGNKEKNMSKNITYDERIKREEFLKKL